MLITNYKKMLNNLNAELNNKLKNEKNITFLEMNQSYSNDSECEYIYTLWINKINKVINNISSDYYIYEGERVEVEEVINYKIGEFWHAIIQNISFEIEEIKNNNIKKIKYTNLTTNYLF